MVIKLVLWFAALAEAAKAQEAVAKAEAEGRQRVAQAEAEAKAIRAKADADAYANERIGRSLTPALVEYLRVQKWDGRMPQVQSSATPMLNLGK